MPIAQCSCGAQYKVTEKSLGRKARCRKCGKVFRIPARKHATIPIADGPDLADLAQAESAAPATVRSASPAETATDSMFNHSGVSTAYDPDAARTSHLPRTRPRTGFWADVGWTLLFFTSPHNLVMFVVVWLLSVGAQFMGCFGLLISFFIVAWYMSVIGETASGDDDLPKFSLEGGIIEACVIPVLQYLLTWVLLFMPAFIYAIYFATAVSTDMLASPGGTDPYTLIASGGSAALPLVALLALAVFLWPAALMCVSMGGLGALLRIDLIVIAVAKTFLPYLAIVLMIAVATFMPGVIIQAAGVAGGGGAGTGSILGAIRSALTFVILACAVEAYFSIVAMRLIGLHYRHYKQRFPWDWE